MPTFVQVFYDGADLLRSLALSKHHLWHARTLGAAVVNDGEAKVGLIVFGAHGGQTYPDNCIDADQPVSGH